MLQINKFEFEFEFDRGFIAARHDGTTFTKNFKSSVAQPKINRDIPDRSQSVFRPNDPQHDVIRDDFNVYLSKPIIQTFSGDPLDFWAFCNRLQSRLPNWLSAERKISYLLQHCEPSVCQNIQYFADLHGEDCYDLAWIELKRRYGQPHIIALACEEQLLGFPKLDKDIPERLNKLSILMKRCRFAMADKTIASNLDSVQFLTTIANKF